jgi:hypothetical protein
MEARMETANLGELTAWWQAALRERGAPRALATLYTELAQRSPRETARFLASEALGFWPGAYEALEVLEQTTPPEERHLLRHRYEAFLVANPFHRESPRVRAKIIDQLVDSGQYVAATDMLSAVTRLPQTDGPCTDEIVRACSVPPPGQEPPDWFVLDPSGELEARVAAGRQRQPDDTIECDFDIDVSDVAE